MKRSALLRIRATELAPWFAGASIALSASWAADGVRDVAEAYLKCEVVTPAEWALTGISIVLFSLSAFWMYAVRQTLFQPRTRFIRSEKPEPRECLVVFLSSLHIDRVKSVEGVPEWFSPRWVLAEDLEELRRLKEQSHDFVWSWEQSLRGLRYHLSRLRTVVVICSKDSIGQVHWFRRILGQYSEFSGLDFKVCCRSNEDSIRLEACGIDHDPITDPDKGWNFEQFDDLSRAVLHLVRQLHVRGFPDEEIMVDFTGGQKVTSVVAAAVTFNRLLKAQYVQTNPPYDVTGYDILLGSTETGGLGA